MNIAALDMGDLQRIFHCYPQRIVIDCTRRGDSTETVGYILDIYRQNFLRGITLGRLRVAVTGNFYSYSDELIRNGELNGDYPVLGVKCPSAAMAADLKRNLMHLGMEPDTLAGGANDDSDTVMIGVCL